MIVWLNWERSWVDEEDGFLGSVEGKDEDDSRILDSISATEVGLWSAWELRYISTDDLTRE
jgi:hypothetical protein